MIGKREIAAGLAVMTAFAVAAIVLGSAWQTRSDQQQAKQDARQAKVAAHRLAVEGYRQDVERWHEIRAGCVRNVSDRRLLLAQAKASYTANVLVSTDPRQPRRTRRARAAEARAYWKAIQGYRLRVPPLFTCAAAFPKPAVPAGVTPLP